MGCSLRRGAGLSIAMGLLLLAGWVRWVGWDPTESPQGWDPLKLHITSESVLGRDHVTEIVRSRARGISAEQAPRFARHLMNLCTRYRLDPALVLALIQVESGFRAGAVSPKGAVGLMQVQPETALAVVARQQDAVPIPREQFLGQRVVHALLDPFHNLSIALAYLAYLRDRYAERSSYVTLAAYNLGPTRMDELLSRPTFKPDKTKRYFDAVRREQRCLLQYLTDCHV
jgi:membrane-bound lytic murein transglycosylase MltF